MERNHVALLEELVLAVNSFHSGSLDYACRAESIIGIHLHAEAFGYASHVASHVAESQDTELLAEQLRASLAVIEAADSHHQQSEHQFCNGIGVLSGSVLGHHAMSCGCCQVDVVISGTCTNHDFQLLCSIEHLAVYLVRADNHCIHVGHGSQKLCLLGVLLKQHKLVAGCLNFFSDTLDSSCCERFFCCY